MFQEEFYFVTVKIKLELINKNFYKDIDKLNKHVNYLDINK